LAPVQPVVRCVGDVMLDVRANSGSLAHGGDIHGRVAVRPGGTSANAAVWAAWAGASAEVHAAVGADLVGELLVASLTARGVGTDGLVRTAAATGVMLVVVESGDRSMVADRGANQRLMPSDLPDRVVADAVLVSGYLLLQEPGRETALAALERADAAWIAAEGASWPLIDRAGAERFFRDTARATMVFANDDEAEALTGMRGPQAASLLGERYVAAAVKHGERGASLCLHGELTTHAVDPVDAADPTGAGDAFDGVLLVALARGEDPGVALDRACRAGALVAASTENWPEPGEEDRP
jgi:sugar/nucleoside kinase (ribokinase family)